MEAKFKADAVTYLTNYNLAQLYQIATELIHNHCRNQDLKKHMKQIEKTSLSKYCNDKPNKFGCHETCNSCSCLKKFQGKKKKAWRPYKSKNHRFLKKRKFQKKSGRCFICGKKWHYAKHCKSNKRILTKLLQLIEDPDLNDEYYEWSDNLEHALLAIDSQSQESDISSESDKLEESSDDEQVLNIFEEHPIDLTMQSSPTFRSVRGKSYQRGIQHNCGLSLKTSHGKFSNMVQQVFKETFGVVSITGFSKVTTFRI